MFGLLHKENSFSVKPPLPVFAISSDGYFYRVCAYMQTLKGGVPMKTSAFMHDGSCIPVDENLKIFTSPLLQDEYKNLRNQSMSFSKCTGEYFDQCCMRFGVRVLDPKTGQTDSVRVVYKNPAK